MLIYGVSLSNFGMSGSPGVVDSHIGGGVLSPEISLHSCDIIYLSSSQIKSFDFDSNAICCLSSQEQAVV